MKVCIATGIYPPSIGGPATYSKLLFDELPKKGIEVSVLSYDSVRHLPKGISHFVYFLKLLKQSKKCDIIYAQDPVSVGLPAMYAAKILNKKFVLRLGGDYAWEQGVSRFGVVDLLDDFVKNTDKYHKKVEKLRSLEKMVSEHANKIIVPSMYLKKIVSQWGVDENKIVVINSAFDSKKDHGSRGLSLGQTSLERQTGPEKQIDNLKTILSVGRLVSWKGFDVLIEVVSELVKNDNSIILYIIGDGPEEENLKSKVKKLNLENNIKFLGSLSQDEVFKYMKSSGVFVLNTKYEGLSHVLLEAMYLGIPVVTTNVCGNPEIIDTEISGLLVKPDDKHALEESIKRILTNKQFRDMLVKNGKEKVKIFSSENMLKTLVQELENVL